MDVSHIRLYPFQYEAIQSFHSWLCKTGKADPPYRYLIASPTGSGKSFLALRILADNPGYWFITPRLEIVADMLKKLYVKRDFSKLSWNEITKIGLDHCITTPIRLRNMLMKGMLDSDKILGIIKDEAHHDNANTYRQIDAMLDERIVQVALTATPYRANAAQTGEFLQRWGEPNWAISYKKAINQGIISLPTFETVPLVDDDVLEIASNGEFVISQLTSEVSSKLEHALQIVTNKGWFNPNGTTTRPTLIGVPTSGVMPELEQLSIINGFQVRCITDETSPAQRQKFFKGCIDCKYALAHINVVSEGVDLPIRRYLDLAPTMSAVTFMQRLGRIMRRVKEGEQPGQWISCNRNIERHAYLLHGCLPDATIVEAQNAFGKPSSRQAKKSRVTGIESLGRIKGFNVKLTTGVTITCYNVATVEGTNKTEFFVILHPRFPAPIWFNRVSSQTGRYKTIGDGIRVPLWDYGTWVKCEPEETIKGYKSNPPGPLTANQTEWFRRDASKYGIDPSQSLDARLFQILPILSTLKLRLE